MATEFDPKRLYILYAVVVGLLTFFYLIKHDLGVLFSLFLLVPSTLFSLLILGFVIEVIIEPILNWLRKKE